MNLRAVNLAAASLWLSMSATAHAATADRVPAGTLRDGTTVEAIELKSKSGVSARILTYGATLQSLVAPDRKGHMADIVLGHDTVAEYEAKQDFFGVTVGRFANRIAKGRFTLDGTTYQLPINNGVNTLHGGGNGFDRKNWTVGAVKKGSTASVVLTLVSPDGDSGYPGEVTATVTYSLDDKGNLTIAFAAKTTKPTIINMTNHALYNLAGHCAPQGAMQQRLTMPASRYTPVDDTLIPTGELAPVKGTPFDFTKGRVLVDALRGGKNEQIRIGRGYDHNWVLDKGLTREPGLAARAYDPASGRVLEVLSTEPGLQMYTGNFIDGSTVGKGGCVYRMGDGFVLEPQKFPDAPNHPDWVSARLDPGKSYRHVMILRLTTAAAPLASGH
jgi:aldose 1-epimerase